MPLKSNRKSIVESPAGRLLATNPSDPKAREFVILKAKSTVGSDETNDFVIRESSVSRRHAIVSFDGGQLNVKDLDSTNGTFVNDRPVKEPSGVEIGDEIRFGASGFVLVRSLSALSRPIQKNRRRPLSLRTIAELTLVAFVIGFGAAQYLAYLLYHEQNKLLLAEAEPLPATNFQQPNSTVPVRTAANSPSSVPTGTRGAVEPKGSPISTPAVAANDARVLSAAVSLVRLFPSSGRRVGQTASEFTLPALDGKTVSLSQYRGKTVILNFWATWCGACRSEMPSLERFYQGIRNNPNIALITVCVDQQGLVTVEPFLAKKNLNFPVLLDAANSVSTSFDVTGIPATFLIDPSGQIVWDIAGAIDWGNPDFQAALANSYQAS